MSATNMNLTKFEEAHALLSMVMEDVGHLVPVRAMVEWWLLTNDPDPVGRTARLAALSVPCPSTIAVADCRVEDVPAADAGLLGEYPPITGSNLRVNEAGQ